MTAANPQAILFTSRQRPGTEPWGTGAVPHDGQDTSLMDKGRDWATEMARMNQAPYFRLLGMEVADLDEGFARLTVPVNESMYSILGALHGGVLSSLSDSAVAMALFTMTAPGEKPVTVELNINYLKPVRGSRLTAEARIVSRGRTIAVGDVDITDDSGRLVARSRATYMVVQ